MQSNAKAERPVYQSREAHQAHEASNYHRISLPSHHPMSGRDGVNAWMIRAGRGGRYIEDFQESNRVAIGWNELEDLTQYATDDALRDAYIGRYGDDKPGRVANALAMLRKFRDDIAKGDYVVSYSTEMRHYLIGRIAGPYQYVTDDHAVGDFSQTREVEWLGAVSRDLLSQAAKNTLGSTLTVFAVPEKVMQELVAIVETGKPAQVPAIDGMAEEANEAELLRDEVITKGHELIKDKIQSLSPDDMEELVAALLRALGYRAKVSPKGPDRGVDVIASPDGLGLTQPRIKAEVKHRGGSIGSNPIRSFLGAMRDGDNGLFISTGGFSREARYEAERATLPVTLIDIDDLADLIVSNYSTFDAEGQALLPLTKLYWPAD